MPKPPRFSEEDLKTMTRWRGLERQQSAAESGDRDVSAVRHSPYKSKLEAAFALYLQNQERHGIIDGWLYEPFTFKLAEGKRYRVDFVTWGYKTLMTEDGDSASVQELTAYECKGWHRNVRDSLTHLKWAAQRFPFFHWKKVVSNGKRGFEIMDVRV